MIFRKIVVCLLFAGLAACGKQAELDNRILGTWRQQPTKGIHTILAFRNNGTFEVDQRIEGKLTKIVEKRGKASGTWEMDKAGSRLTMVTLEASPEIGWPTRTVVYDIVEFDPLTLHLMDPGGKHENWKKIRRSKSADGEGNGIANYKIAPLVVNLAPSKNPSHRRYKWICTEIDILLNNYDISAGLHPQVHEKAIFFLNAKTYGDLNTQDKLQSAAQELKDLLNPYLDGRISNLSFQNTIVTGRMEAMDEFLAQYTPQGGDASETPDEEKKADK